MKLLHSTIGATYCGLVLLSGCATTTAGDGAAEMPIAWVNQFLGKETECKDIDSTYSNTGEAHQPRDEGAESAYLSELLFSRLPGGKLPETVTIITNREAGRLSVGLKNDVTTDLGYEIGCSGGWHVLKKTRSGEYLGEGVVEKHYGQVSYFRSGNEDELIVHIFVDAEFNSMYVFNTQVSKEAWYRFLPAKSDSSAH